MFGAVTPRSRVPRAAATAAWPKEIPPSLGGRRCGMSTRARPSRSALAVRSSSSRFWKTPPERTTVPRPRAAATRAQAAAVARGERVVEAGGDERRAAPAADVGEQRA